MQKLLTSLGMASESEADADDEPRTTRRTSRRRSPRKPKARARSSSRRTRCSARRPTTRPTTPTKARWTRSRRRRRSSTTRATPATPRRRPKTVRPSPAPGDGAATDYKAYTTRFDEVVDADELCDPEELQRLRDYLDKQLQNLSTVVSRLANRLQRRLMAQQNRSWEFDLEEGVLDTARLPRVIIDPQQPLSFKQEKDMEFRDTAVTLLIDNSGSMRGRPITVAATCADILARTLERCGVKVEILGFTTRAWKGGQSREAWLQAGKPPNPGRLNDLRHSSTRPPTRPGGARARTSA